MKINDRIKLIRTESGLSQEAFAISIGLKRANYAQIEAGKQNPTLQTLSEIVRIYNKTYPYVIDGVEGDEKIAPNLAPIVAPNQKKGINLPKIIAVEKGTDNEVVSLVPVKAAAGYLNGYADPEFIEKLPTIEIPGIKGGTHRAFEVRGHSMMPNHHPGSIAIGRWVENVRDIRSCRVYILVTKFDGIVLKRVLNYIDTEGKLILMSDNDNKREFPNYPLDPEDILEIWYWRGGIIREIPEPGNTYTRINDLEARLSLIESRVSGRLLS